MIHKIQENFEYSRDYNIGCLNIHGSPVIANKSTNNNVMLFFCFRFENSIL